MTRLVTPTFDHAKQPIFGQHLIFVNLHQHARKQFIPSVHSSDTVNFRVLSPHWPHPFLTMPTPKTFNHLLVCISLYLHANNHLVQSAHSRDTVNFRVRVLRPNWTHTFLSMTNQNIFNHFLIFVHLYQHAKNVYFSDTVNFRVLSPDWAEHIFDHVHPKIFQSPFHFHEFVPACKK